MSGGKDSNPFSGGKVREKTIAGPKPYKNTAIDTVNMYNSEDNEQTSKDTSTDTLALTQRLNETLFKYTRKSISIIPLSVMKYDIKNYRPLSAAQLESLETLSHAEIIELIHIFNQMMSTIEKLLA